MCQTLYIHRAVASTLGGRTCSDIVQVLVSRALQAAFTSGLSMGRMRSMLTCRPNPYTKARFCCLTWSHSSIIKMCMPVGAQLTWARVKLPTNLHILQPLHVSRCQATNRADDGVAAAGWSAVLRKVRQCMAMCIACTWGQGNGLVCEGLETCSWEGYG